MMLRYYPETDSLYITLKPFPSESSEEVRPGVVLDFDPEGNLVGIDIDHASKHVDLSGLSIEPFPAPITSSE
jgi:uncharacterized protein YuzE